MKLVVFLQDIENYFGVMCYAIQKNTMFEHGTYLGVYITVYDVLLTEHTSISSNLDTPNTALLF